MYLSFPYSLFPFLAKLLNKKLEPNYYTFSLIMDSQSDVDRLQYLSLVEGIVRECGNYNFTNDETVVEFLIDMANESDTILVC